MSDVERTSIGSIHEHQYTIPMEYRHKTRSSMGGYVHLENTYVTKLRCACGSEINRDTTNTNHL